MRLLPTLAIAALLTSPALMGAQAQMPAPYVPDDIVYLDLSTEGFVTTKTAKVQVAVVAGGNDEKAATLRDDMQKAVGDLAKADWRLTSFNRSQDQTGLTRWDAIYEARVTEKDLAGMADRAKKLSKPGLQLSIATIDFSPTLAEVESRKSELRQELIKRATDELSKLNATLPGRTYRISDISFGNNMVSPMAPRPMMMKAMRGEAAAAPMMADSSAPAEVAQQLVLTAHVAYAARPPVPAAPPQKP